MESDELQYIVKVLFLLIVCVSLDLGAVGKFGTMTKSSNVACSVA
jgi:hypothetical protein